MTITLHLTDEEWITSTQRAAQVQKRTVSQQIEHWAKLGKLIEANPHLPYRVIKDLLEGIAEIQKEGTEPLVWEDE